MTPKIYAKSAPPWEHGGSSVERYESGLVRVSQEYLCPTDQRDTIAATFAIGAELTGIPSPATDGLYIYPHPQAADLNNGFSKISVTAYGRVQDTFSQSMTYSQVTVTVDTTATVFLAPTYRVLWVTKSGELPVPANFNQLLYRDPMYVLAGGNFSQTSFARKMTFTMSPSTGFGEMQEQVYNVSITPRDTTLTDGVETTGGDVVIVDPPIVDPPA